jgi:hypothetical protein
MEISELDRAQIIIDTLKARVHVLEEALLSEQVSHALTRLAYQMEQQSATEALDG